MHSSTSSSDRGHWVAVLCLALLTTVLVLGCLEVFWRTRGHSPNVVDDQRLWATERNRIGVTNREIALLGSSRMETDISVPTLRRLVPDYRVVSLFVDGTCANATLRDLGADMNFKGVVVAEITSECILFGDEGELSQHSYVRYYHKTYTMDIGLNRSIATFLQEHLTVIDPYLNPIKVMAEFIAEKKIRKPNYVSTFRDRSRSADYSKLNLEKHKAKRLEMVREHYQSLAQEISVSALENRFRDLNEAIVRIERRGGRVVLVRFPVSGEHWLIDEAFFPKSRYWDALGTLTNASLIHFKDSPELRIFQCPDTSHLDVKDTEAFTVALIREIQKKKLF